MTATALRRVRIKFCGFTRADDVRAALDLGVDALGFNLARGPRRIGLDQAASLAALVPPPVLRVALFVDADEATILAALTATRCGAVQLHGSEAPELAERLRRRVCVIKACTAAAAAAAPDYPADALLIDAPPVLPESGEAPPLGGTQPDGGSGRSWDYARVAPMAARRAVFLAGGLHAGNVAEAIRVATPFAVDVASGIESAPGIKARERMAAFVAACVGAGSGER